MTNIYHANPFDLSATGFYFSSFKDYADQAAKHRNVHGDPVEEFEFEFIDGDNHRLFAALKVNQVNLEQWFDQFEDLDEDDLAKMIYLAEDQHCDMNEILNKLEDVVLFEGTATEYAENYLEETGLFEQIPESLRFYFDIESFASDMLINGDITELRVDNTDYTMWGC